MRAMVLSAGFGSRLRSLTDSRPKPLVPIANVPIIEYSLRLLRAHGITEAVINLHYLPESIKRALGDGSRLGMSLRYSWEREILGSGGGVKRAEDFLRDGTCVVVNADTLCEVDLTAAILAHHAREATATMVVKEDPQIGPAEGVQYGEDDCIWQVAGRGKLPIDCSGPVRRGIFVGIHILEPRVFDSVPADRPVHINRETYPAMLTAGEPIYAYTHVNHWRDVGTLRDFLKANMGILFGEAALTYFDPLEDVAFDRHLAKHRVFIHHSAQIDGSVRLAPPVLVGAGCKVGPQTVVGPGVVLGENCAIGHGARIKNALLLAGTTVADGRELSWVIADGPNEIPLGERVSNEKEIGETVFTPRCVKNPRAG